MAEHPEKGPNGQEDGQPLQPTNSPRRERAPTITIDTTAVNSNPASRAELDSQSRDQQRPSAASQIPPNDDAVSPTSMAPGSGFPAADRDQRAARPDLRAETSFDSRESRPQSPHNVSTPVTAHGERGQAAFLSVPPANSRSRQNSVDSDDASNTVAPSVGEPAPKTRHSSTKIMEDTDALQPDRERDLVDFQIQNNPFAFTPGQLSKLFDPKSLSAFWALGGLVGLEKGLRSNRKTGLSTDETLQDGSTSFEQATGRKAPVVNSEWSKPASAEKEQATDDKNKKTKKKKKKEEELKDRRKKRPPPPAELPGKLFSDRRRVYRDNRIPAKKGKSFLQIMWITYNDKVLILLTIAAVISLAIGLYQALGIEHKPGEAKIEWVEGVAIIAAIAIVVIVGSINDFRKERQFVKLNRKKQDRIVKVVRSGKTVELSVYDLMAGDVVHLDPGDLIPVDGVLIEGFGVKCDESQATGESDIIRKTPADEVYDAIENHRDLKKMDPFIQSGARIMEGVGKYMATSTGIYSSYGKTIMSLDDEIESTPLQAKLSVIATNIAMLGGAAGILLFLVLFIQFLVRLRNQPPEVTPTDKGMMFLNIFIMVVTIIVVAVPEGLPLAVTLALSFATNRMSKENNLVRTLQSCEVMGNATTICSDKTGTLTQNKMTVVAGTIGTSARFGSAKAISSDSESDLDDAVDRADPSVAHFASMLSPEVRNLLRESISLNSTAFEGDVGGEKAFIGSKTETALLELASAHFGMGPVAEERESAKMLQIIPFDSSRKCMGIVIKLDDGRARLYIKGASEIVLARCVRIISDPAKGISSIPITEGNMATIHKLIVAYASHSLRTIGLIYRDLEQWPPHNATRSSASEVEFKDLFRDMTFVGLVGIQDPLRDGVFDAVKECQRAGVVVRMVTGDNKLTAEAIAKECGILFRNSIIMEGPDFRRMKEDEQKAIAPRLHVMARSSPEDKRILVEILKSQGEIVAVTGDGTNDAPALKIADIGFSMGITGTEVAKEASDIILMDDNFSSIVNALRWGRAVNDAVKRFLQFQLTVNITAVVLTFVTAVASADEDSVLTAVQLLWVNLIMDTLAALALATDPPHPSVLDRKPERTADGIISITMWKMIIGQALYQLAITFMLYWGSLASPDVLPTSEVPTPAQVNTLVFNTFVWMQIFNQWNNRRLDNNFNIFEGVLKNWIFITISVIMVGLQVLIILVGDVVFEIPPEKQTAVQWGIAVVLGFISIPFGMVIRLIPDAFVEALIPSFMRSKHRKTPGITVTNEENPDNYQSPLTEVRDQLAFLKRVKGGRLNNLRFVMRHPRETLRYSRSPSHSRSASLNGPRVPATPTLETADSVNTPAPPTPESRQRSRSMRSRSNSALGAPTVMAGLVAAGVAGGWQSNSRTASRDEGKSGVGGEGDGVGGGGGGGSISGAATPTGEETK